jgi:hypothetical protein
MSPDGPSPLMRRLLALCLVLAALVHGLAVLGGALSAARPGPHPAKMCRGAGASRLPLPSLP